MYETVKELCKKKNITVAQLERNTGLARGAIGKWRKCSPQLNSLEKVADALGVSVTTLINKSKKKVE